MAKPRTNYVIDLLMLIVFIVTAVTGLIIFFFLPSGVRQGGYREFFGIIKGTWAAWHNYAGIAFIILVLLHFILHWDWMACMTKKIFDRQGRKKD